MSDLDNEVSVKDYNLPRKSDLQAFNMETWLFPLQ